MHPTPDSQREAFLVSWTQQIMGYGLVIIVVCAALTFGLDLTAPGMSWTWVGVRFMEFGVAFLLMWRAYRAHTRPTAWFIGSVTWLAMFDGYGNASLAEPEMAYGGAVIVIVALGLFPSSMRQVPARVGPPAVGAFLGLWWGGIPDPATAIAMCAIAATIAALLAMAAHSLARRAVDLQREVVEASLAAQAHAEAREAFMRSLSHEMRTPLNGLVGLLDDIRHGPLGGRQAQALALADQAAGLLDMLVGDALSGAEDSPDIRPRQVHALVPVRAALAAAGESHHIEVRRTPAGPVTVDPRRMQQIVQLLLNYTGDPPDGPAARISVDWWDDTLSIEVHGTGQGAAAVTDGLQSRLLRRVVTALGGQLVEPPSLATHIARVTLPAPLSIDRDRAPTDLKGHVLIVDDNRVNRLVLRSMVERLGATVDEVEDGQQALNRLSERRYAIVLMDIDMPVMDGLQATTLARRAGFTCPIVAVTAKGDAQTQHRAFLSGMDGFLTKPVRVEDLVPLLCTALRTHPTAVSGVVQSLAG